MNELSKISASQGANSAEASVDPETTVAVVITTYNHSHYLGEALASVAAQTRAADEIIVVDDGSEDDPAAVVSNWPGVQLIRQSNQGLSAARNTGLVASRSDYVLFLDADDLLAADAISVGLRCFERAPEAAFVFGAHRRVDLHGRPMGGIRFDPITGDALTALLRGNLIAMHATVLYRRQLLLAEGGFRPELRSCEDYDVYLRLARNHPIACHSSLVADYRWHGENMSDRPAEMLRTVLQVSSAHRPNARDGRARWAAWAAGRRNWRHYYVKMMLERSRKLGLSRLARLAQAMRVSPRGAVRHALSAAASRVPFGRSRRKGRGRIRLGDLGSPWPVSSDFGWDRGTPIDRYYIEAFLAQHALDVGGHVLEVGDSAYSQRFGGARVAHQDVLHVTSDNPAATIVGDLAAPGTLPAATFDCIICTQTLQLIFDVPTALRQLHEALRPGGVLLLTVPFISQIDRGQWGAGWYWGFTPAAIERLFRDVFDTRNTMIEAHGNVFAATSFLQGLSVEEIDRQKLDVRDEAYPMLVTVRAVRT